MARRDRNPLTPRCAQPGAAARRSSTATSSIRSCDSRVTIVGRGRHAADRARRARPRAADRAARSFRPARSSACSIRTIRRPGCRAATGASCSAPTTRAATCSRPSSTARASRSRSASMASLFAGMHRHLARADRRLCRAARVDALIMRAADVQLHLSGDPDRAC